MKEKKNIDRIFQEKFKDFEREPNEKNWDNITSRLDKKNRKKTPVIPLWLKLGGVAAVLAVILASLLFTQQNEPLTNEPGVVFENPEETREDANPEDENQEIKKELDTSQQITSEDEIVENGSESSASDNRSNSKENSEKGKALQPEKVNNSDRGNNISQSQIAGNNSNPSEQKNEKGKLAIQPEVDMLKTSGLIVFSEEIEADSIKIAPVSEEENALAQIEEEKEKNEKELEEIATVDTKKMRLSTFAAPLFYKNIGSGNELSNQFSNNSSSSEVTLTYGVKVAYQISKKLRIRTGISKVDMSYNIQDISYSPTAMGAAFENIRPAEDNLDIRSENTPNPSGLPMGNSNENALTTSVFTPGEINQQFGYIEIPLEIEYALINKRFGLNVIGGGSSLFLDNNRVDLVSGESKTNLGEASNINSTSFSTNIGVGMDYKLTDKFSISVEPIFKYQLNTFDNVQNVQPINFGIYSGLSFKF